jgi:hypothetical protein
MDEHIEKIQTALKLKIKNIDIYSSDNKVLATPFEHYCAIQASISSGKRIFQNDFITPEEKEQIGLPRRDLGVDLTDKIEMIGQAKNWSQSIGLKDLGTFLQSQVSIKEDGTPFIKWTEMHLYRSSESSLSRNLDTRRFIDIIYDANKFKKYLKDLQDEDENKDEKEKKEEKKEDIKDEKKLIISETLQLLGETKNIVISVPIYEDDIILAYLKKNSKQKCIIYVQNKISETQYTTKLKKFKDIKIELIHSFKAEECVGYDKIFFTDAHRIHPQHLFDSSVPLNIGYIDSIRPFIEKSNNCVLSSHHIQEIDTCRYYRKSLRDCINKGLCNSYEVLVSVFDVKPSLETIAEWVISILPNNCIVKTHNKKDGKEFVEYINKLLPNSAVYFDSDDRSLDCLNHFKNGKIRFLCSPLLLDESFNAPICDSVVFLRPSDEQMYFTSVINRCLLPHPLKKQHSKIFFPSYKGDEKTILNMINTLATYDDKLDRKKINNRECHIVNISVENEKPEIRPDTHNSIQDEYTWKFDKIKTDSEHLEYVLEYEQKNEKLPDDYEWFENIKKDIVNDIDGDKRKTLEYKHILRKLCFCKNFILWLLEITNKTPNEEQLYCIISILCNHKNMFIQGPGGTGKSYIIECIRQICSILFIQLIVLAPTGCASNAIKGDTIHSFLKSPPSFIRDEAICIVDEISMVGINKFKELCKKLSFIKKTKKLMGGLQIVYSGDFAQLEPVDTINIVGSDQWKLIDSYKLLTINMRTQTEKLQGLLDKIRIGNIDKNVEEYLKSRTNIPISDKFDHRDKLTVLFYDNKSIKAYNEEKLSELSEILYTFKPIIRLSNKSNKKLADLLSKNIHDEKDNPKSLFNPLKCCLHAKVVITKNIDKKNGAFNGAKGFIYEIDEESGEIKIYLADKNQTEIKVRPICLKRQYENGNIKEDDEDMSFCSCEEHNFILESCTICSKPLDYTKGDYYDILNYPFELGWATSIHKAQGQTIKGQLQIFLPSFFYPASLIYVAVSRITHANNLYITSASEILFDQIKPSSEVKNIVEFGLECKKCKAFTHNKDNICDSCNNFCKVCQSPLTDHTFLCDLCNIVPFEPPVSLDDFCKKPIHYQNEVVRNCEKNTNKKWKIFIQAYKFKQEFEFCVQCKV